jgi:hypothetical protein
MEGYDFKQEDFQKVENNETGSGHEITEGGISWKVNLPSHAY